MGSLALVSGVVLVQAAVATTVTFDAPGADKSLASSLKAASVLLNPPDKKKQQDPQDLFSAARSDYQRLVGAAYAKGYYAPVVHILLDGREAASIAPLDAPKAIGSIQVSVAPGPQFTFGRATVAPLAPKTKLPDGFAPGKVAESGAISSAAQAGVKAWREAGHPKADLGGQKITADAPNRRLDADVTLAPGPAARLGRFVVTGESKVRRNRIYAIAGFPTGQPYTPERIDESANRLRDTGAFASVAVTEGPVNPDGTMDVTAAVVDAKKHRIGFGAALSSSEGADLSAFWLDRNVFGGAESFKLSGEVSGIGATDTGRSYTLTARFDRPATFDARTAFYTLGTLARESLTDYTANKAELEAGFTRKVSRRLTLSYGAGLMVERVTDTARTRTYKDLYFPLEATWDSRNDKLDATKGYYLDAYLRPFKGFSGTGSGAQLKFDGRGYLPLGKAVVLAGRVQVGEVFGPSISDTPRDYLFYSGGGGTVRGQPYQSLGVYGMGNGVRSGGKSFLGLSGEVRAKVTKSIGVVAFYDAGYVGANSLGSGGAWQAGAGLGFRYYTGIGPIRVDVAAPVSGNTGKGVQLYIGIGQAF